ncbi:MAG: HlyD family efflux transporter periplasmic adaptor subunit [Acidimicrobiia bacterium]|nr:HlyD family efflux transporter periplasmic adaptor subunit [Acidimicrobiia bacterium]
MKRWTILALLALLLVIGGTVAAGLWFQREQIPIVTAETIKTRDLTAVVSASGKIQPKRLVNISADASGRVINLAVNEGDRVARGQFLLQIDPKSLRTRVDGGTASLQAAEASLDQLRQGVETARVQLQQAQQNLTRQKELASQQLNTREALEKADNEVRAADSALREREKQIGAQAARISQERATLESARYDLSKVRIESPIDGIVTRRNIQEGETAVIGTMNNAGTVLLTLADMSIIQAEVEVDETNVPLVAIGQPAVVTIDALPDRTFKGRVTEIGNSPIQSASATTSSSRQATNFKVVVVVEDHIPDVRPGFTCTADITTATRQNVTAVPIPAVAVRELLYDAKDQIVRQPPDPNRHRGLTFMPGAGAALEPTAQAAELQPGQTRRETEGVFILRADVVEYAPIKVGIAGDQYFEVLTGLSPGDQVITGPYNTVRNLMDGDKAQVGTPGATRPVFLGFPR